MNIVYMRDWIVFYDCKLEDNLYRNDCRNDCRNVSILDTFRITCFNPLEQYTPPVQKRLECGFTPSGKSWFDQNPKPTI